MPSRTGRSGTRGRLRIPPVFELRVEIQHVAPPIWRQLLVYGSTSLHGLHEMIQAAFGWENSHLYEFRLGRRRFHSPYEEQPRGSAATDAILMELPLKPGSTLAYTYDFGDDWHHEIRVLAVRSHEPGAVYPICLDGARACPPEDSGGPPGYEQLLAILANRKHPDHRERREWVGAHFNPETFDMRAVNRVLELEFN